MGLEVEPKELRAHLWAGVLGILRPSGPNG